MTVQDGALERKDEGKFVLVAISLDNSGHELLNWALVKVAKPGDHVLAVHVVRSRVRNSGETPADASMQEALDAYLAVYEGICTLKEVDLVGEISHGSSIRRVIVGRAKSCGATTVVVGFTGHTPFGAMKSVVSYCTKNLPATATLLGIHNGKVCFQRLGTKVLSGLTADLRSGSSNSLLTKGFTIDREKPDLTASEASKTESACKCGFTDSSQNLRDVEEHKSSFKTSIDDETESIFTTATEFEQSDLAEEDNFHLVPEDESSLSLPRKLPEAMPGWPLLKRASLPATATLKDSESRKLSVVQWVMNLPNRSLPTTPPSKFNPLKSKSSMDRRLNKSDECVYRFFCSAELREELENILANNKSECRWFSVKELQNFTSQFSLENLIGKGGSGQVYRGYLQDERPIAVKILKSSKQVAKDFLQEVNILTSLQHKNISPLIGVSAKSDELISVYNFYSRGNLEENLHSKEGRGCALPWNLRYKVAVGISRALCYIHSECPQPVIHRDVKSSNILLSDDFEPLLSDFGLAIWAPMTPYAAIHADVLGTFGYLAPEYFMYGKVSDKIDVYSYGVVLLELLTGRKPISKKTTRGNESLVMWAMPILVSGDLDNLLDPELAESFDKDQLQRMVAAASLCIRRRASLRPSMGQILRLLQGDEEVTAWLKCNANPTGQSDSQDDEEEAYPNPTANSKLGLTLMEGEDDITSISSMEQANHQSLEAYLRDRCSRSSSFD